MSSVDLHVALRLRREEAGLTAEQVTHNLVLAAGWVDAWESGLQEPPLAILSQLLGLYEVSLASFFASVALGEHALAFERHLVVQEEGDSLLLKFPMGTHKASVSWTDATAKQVNDVIGILRSELANGSDGAKTRAVGLSFMSAVSAWPHLNPSDIWYFLVSHAYQDQYNHPVGEAGRDLGQSWKRTGGWAFERIIRDHYEPFLRSHSVWLEIPRPERKRDLLQPMHLTSHQEAMEKADVLAVGKLAGVETCFGVIHAKASLAERRTDDAPLSRELMQRGFVSPLVTMDCKAAPAPHPVNRGEFGSAQGGAERVSQKRLNVERDNIFDAAFSYNSNTAPTPDGTAAAARIHVVDFSNADDAFSRRVVNKWRARHGNPPL